jgi:hypothetical protein
MTATVIDSLVMTLGLDDADYTKGVQKAEQSNKKLRDDAQNTAKQLSENGKQGAEFFGQITKRAVEFFAVIAAGRGMQQLYSQAVQVGAATGRMAANIGTATDKLSAWQNVARQLGQSSDDVSGSLNSIAQQRQQFAAGNRAGALGLFYMSRMAHVNGFSGDPSDTLLQLAQYFHTLTGPQAQFQGQQMGLGSGTVTMLQQTPVDQLKQMLATSSTTNPDQAKAAEDLTQAFQTLQTQIDGLASELMLLSSTPVVQGVNNFAKGIWAITQALEGKMSWDQIATGMFPMTPLPATTSPDNYERGSAQARQRQSSAQQDARKKEALQYFISQGWTPDQAAGIVANINAESSFDPSAKSTYKGKDYNGIAQWEPTRWAQLMKFSGTPTPSYEQQLAFINWELNNSESAAGNALRQQKTAFGAGSVMDSAYERSANPMDQYTRGSSAQSYVAMARAIAGSVRAASTMPTHSTVNVTVNTTTTNPKAHGEIAAKAAHRALVSQANTGLH